MDETFTVVVQFDPGESGLYQMFLRRCEAKGETPSDYFKNLAKADLAWGQFARRGKKDGGK